MPRQLSDIIFDLKFGAKRFEQQSNQMRKKANEDKLKIKKAIQQNNKEGAQIYAENVIREQNMSMFYLRTASRMEGIVNKLEINQSMQAIVKGLDQVNNSLKGVMGDSDMKKVNQVLGQFEGMMEKMDNRVDVITNAMEPVTESQINRSEVDNLIAQVAAEHQLQLQGDFAQMQQPNAAIQPQFQPVQGAGEADLNERLRQLTGGQ
ncbi:MAG: putative charged multivesicular body protein 1a [Streblomastix strix]|uniref:Putative charged multivesicular body protein 1a n=1 Tax=Streblomastix strix TaxID=222440 RepID=A0A5J4X8Z9_9EUKA|nr:MAG: putative charged multivesicular body protein 1a [Streblomastix strix]